MAAFWSKYCDSLAESLRELQVTSSEGKNVPPEDAFVTLCKWVRTVREARRTLHLIGNGASACMASHMAVDWTKNAGVRAAAYNDLAFLTAIGNDLGYDKVFAQPLTWYGERGDLLVTISSSGNSLNVINAISAARDIGLQIVTLSGMKSDNRSRRLGDLNFYVPAFTYGIAESSHQILLHAWLDRYMDVQEWTLDSPQKIPMPS